jgi:hypothetical protein
MVAMQPQHVSTAVAHRHHPKQWCAVSVRAVPAPQPTQVVMGPQGLATKTVNAALLKVLQQG